MKTAILRTAFAALSFVFAVQVTLAQSGQTAPGHSALAFVGPTHQFVEDPDGQGLIPVSPGAGRGVPGNIQPYGFLWTGYDATVEYDIYGVRRSQSPPGHFLDPLGLFSSSSCSQDGCVSSANNRKPIVNALSNMVKFCDNCPRDCNCGGCQVNVGEQKAAATQEADAKPATPAVDQLPPNTIPKARVNTDDASETPVQAAPEVSNPPEPTHDIQPPRNVLPRNLLPNAAELDDSSEKSSRRNSKSRTVTAIGAFIKA